MHQSAIIRGGSPLEGATVASTDLRASAALIMAGLISNGYTKVIEINHLDRGYYKFHEKLAALGGNVERVSETEEPTKVAEKV